LWGEVENKPCEQLQKMPESAVSAVTYNSIYRHGVDEKRRVQIPAKWRPAQPDIELTVILWQQNKAGACLRVLPPEQMQKLRGDLEAMPSSEQKASLKRTIGSYSEQVVVDKAGRICLPEEMAREAMITDQAVLVGMLDRFEIWNPQRHQDVRTSDAVIAARAFAMLE
jgi:MraZ protein